MLESGRYRYIVISVLGKLLLETNDVCNDFAFCLKTMKLRNPFIFKTLTFKLQRSHTYNGTRKGFGLRFKVG